METDFAAAAAHESNRQLGQKSRWLWLNLSDSERYLIFFYVLRFIFYFEVNMSLNSEC